MGPVGGLREELSILNVGLLGGATTLPYRHACRGIYTRYEVVWNFLACSRCPPLPRKASPQLWLRLRFASR